MGHDKKKFRTTCHLTFIKKKEREIINKYIFMHMHTFLLTN